MLRLLAVVSAAGAAYFFTFLPAHVAAHVNPTLAAPPYEATPRGAELYRQLLVADLHADTLLWDRDLLARARDGHVDVPRLLDANVAIQTFTIVTKAPLDIRTDGNDPSSDAIRWLAFAQLRPPSAWRSLMARALDQVRAFDRAVQRSGHELAALRQRADLDRYLDRRARDGRVLAGMLGIEGAHALDGNAGNVTVLFDAGVRMMSPAHLADNEVAGSAQGIDKGGLTELGRDVVRRMQTIGMLVDLAHASPAAFDDVITMATRPVVVSHTGVRGTCDNVRNLSDDQLRAVANTGGIVGIGFWETATCGRSAAAIARAMRHAADVVGVGHVALGSDFDGAVAQPFDVTGLVQLADALLAERFTEAEIRAVMGGNIVRILRATLP